MPPRLREVLDSETKKNRTKIRGWVFDRDRAGEWEVTSEWIADALRSSGHSLSSSSIRTYRRAIKRQESFPDD